ncbi:MAG: DUF2281 domain-containing protein [Jaaginema sp. PMC 1079.18]|nr:DUF2281 domain-containing protein [Jaaginema sp. PMC 1080.18]MEC4849542.1 DUF2281 domain-containing protein [Jaaginema sp. PMC 1079.18]MEC4865734.1 DUF2281 domain-containing protein [Jaaginema sp. PMC 1078.18]
MNPLSLKKYNALPDPMKKQVEDFIDFLAQKYASPQQEFNPKTERKYGYGSLAGKLIIPDDFDEPLAELEEYM